MSNISLLFFVLSFSIFYLSIINSIYKNKISKDLLIFIIIGILLVFCLSIFYFHFNEIVLSILISILLIVNNCLIVKEMKIISNKYYFTSLIYLIYFIYVFIFLLTKFF